MLVSWQDVGTEGKRDRGKKKKVTNGSDKVRLDSLGGVQTQQGKPAPSNVPSTAVPPPALWPLTALLPAGRQLCVLHYRRS